MRITLCREAGGLGDAIRVASVGRTLQEQGHEVTVVTLADYETAYRHIMKDGFNLVKVNLEDRRYRDDPLDAKRFPYLAKFPADRMVDLYCPAYRFETQLGTKCDRNRLEIFAAEAGVEPVVHRWNVTELEHAEAVGYLRAINPTGKPMVAIQPFASDGRNNWPKSNWQHVIDQLSASGSLPLVIHNKYSAIRDFMCCKRLAGLSIELVAAILEQCAAAVMPNSALYHLANYLRIPTLGIFASNPGSVEARNYLTDSIEPSDEARNLASCSGVCWGRPAHGTCISRRDAVEGCACPAIETIDKELVARLSCEFARGGAIPKTEPFKQMSFNRNRR